MIIVADEFRISEREFLIPYQRGDLRRNNASFYSLVFSRAPRARSLSRTYFL